MCFELLFSDFAAILKLYAILGFENLKTLDPLHIGFYFKTTSNRFWIEIRTKFDAILRNKELGAKNLKLER
jgi:hypothetical protein